LFDAAMQEYSTVRVSEVVDAYDFRRFSTIVDERVLPDNPRDDLSAYLQDLNMLHSLSGRERSETQFATLLTRSGFRLTRLVRTQGPFVVIEGEPVERPPHDHLARSSNG